MGSDPQNIILTREGEDFMELLLSKIKVGGLSLDARLREVINSDYYKQLSEPLNLDNNNKDEGTKARYLKQIIKRTSPKPIFYIFNT